MCVCGHRRKSPAHLGVIHLVVPKDLLASREWEGPPSSRTDETMAESVLGRQGGGDSVEERDEEEEEEDDDERELSLSVPASPTLTQRPPPVGRIQRLRSQSFDDIVSSLNNEDLSPPLSARDQDPTTCANARNFAFETTPPLEFESDSGTEPLPGHRLGAVYDHSHLVSSQPEMGATTTSSSGGRLTQLRGKLLGRVRRGQGGQKTHQSLEVPLQPMRPRSHHVTSDSGPDSVGDVAEVEEEKEVSSTRPSSSQQPQQPGSLVTHRLLAVGQRFRNAPPSLLRRMGVVSGSGQHHVTQAPPQVSHQEINEDDIRKSNSNFITL